MRRAEWKHSGVIDQDVDMAPPQLDGLFRNSAGARGIAQVGRDEIGFPARGPYLRNRVFAALYVAADHNDLNARLGQLVGHRAADAACGSGNESCRRHLRLLVSLWSSLAAGLSLGLRKDDIGRRGR